MQDTNVQPLRVSHHMDGVVRSADRLSDLGFLERLVRKAAKAANMRVLNMTTSCIEEDLAKLRITPFADEGGYSILCLISTSHIALHVWPARRCFMFDAVSCRPFEPKDVHDLIKRELEVTGISYCETYRGDYEYRDRSPAVDVGAWRPSGT